MYESVGPKESFLYVFSSFSEVFNSELKSFVSIATKVLPLSAFVIIIYSSLLNLLRIFIYLIELLQISGFKANFDRVFNCRSSF